MPTVNMLHAKTHLSRLVEEVERGAEREIVIARNGKPVARLVPIGSATPKGKRLGLLAGQYPSSSQEEFDATNELVGRLFRGET